MKSLSRSQIMSKIRGKDTRPEVRLRRRIWALGLRYRKNYKLASSRPDIVFVSAKVAVFVDGCQWHGCPDHYVKPRTREDFWAHKLAVNVERDRVQTIELRQNGWIVLRFWEHDIDTNLENVCSVITDAVLNNATLQDHMFWRVFKVEPLDDSWVKEKRHIISLSQVVQAMVITRIRSTKKWKRSSD
jgi:DNA mismatch endonuclease (patch repair protein)